MRLSRILSAALLSLMSACGPQVVTDNDAASMQDVASQPDTTQSSGPFVCQNAAYVCADRAALDACEASRSLANCTRLTLEPCTRPSFRLQGTCPSAAEVCRSDNGAMYCTHSCSRDSDCPLPEGGNGVCQAVGMGVSTCVRP